MNSEELREHIAKLMISAEWRGGGSNRQLAVETGLPIGTVQRLAREAAAGIRLAAGDLPALVREEMARLDLVFELAIGRQGASKDGVLYANPDLKAAVSAVQLKAQLAGALNRGAQAKPDAPDNYEAMAIGEKRKLLEAALLELNQQDSERRH